MFPAATDQQQVPHRALLILFKNSSKKEQILSLALAMLEHLIWDPTVAELDDNSSQTAQAQLHKHVQDFLKAFKDPKEKLIIYYGGSAYVPEEAGSEGWRWHATFEQTCAKHTPQVDPSLVIDNLIHTTNSDILFIFDCPFDLLGFNIPTLSPDPLHPERKVAILALPSSADFSSSDTVQGKYRLIPGCRNFPLTAGKGESTKALRKSLVEAMGPNAGKDKASLQEVLNRIRGKGYTRAECGSALGGEGVCAYEGDGDGWVGRERCSGDTSAVT